MQRYCVRCESDLTGLHHNRIYCDVCLPKVKQEQWQLAQERRRVKLGGKKMGEPVPCRDCGEVFLQSRPLQVRCRPCQRTDLNRRAAEARRSRGSWVRPGTKARVGAEVACKVCAKPFTKDHNNSVYCLECRGRKATNARYREPKNKLKACMSNRLAKAMKRRKSGPSWSTYFDYSLTELMRHLERQFPPGMSWDNYGQWHVDHVVPVAKFDMSSDEEAKRCFAMTNLRPLWALDNQKKQARHVLLV